jgi:hypothetical protein
MTTKFGTTTTTTEPRAREPWPLAVALALLAMIGVCAAFFAVASLHPDPPVDLERAGLRPYEGYAGPDATGAGAAR